MVYYKPVKVTIDALGLNEIIINVVVRYYNLSDSIVTNQGSHFILKFWSSLWYFVGIKQKLFTAFYLQTDGQIERQNSIMEAYLWFFVNFEQDNWVYFLLIAKFAYNNAKNASIDHLFFELNCRYHPRVFYKEDLNPCSKLKIAEELSSKLWNLMAAC